MRTIGDYGGLNAITLEQANAQIVHSEQFLILAEKTIGKPPTS